MERKKVPNDLLRDVRERLFGTQQALADAANALLAPAYLLSANDIGKLERGAVERPSAPRRKALRTVCQVETDAEIGLVRRPKPRDPEAARPQMIIRGPVEARLGHHIASLGHVQLPPSAASGVTAPGGWRIVGYLAVPQKEPHPSALTVIAPSAAPDSMLGEMTRLEVGHQTSMPDLRGYPDEDWNSFVTVTRLLAGQRQAVAPAALLRLVEAHRDCLASLFRKAESDPVRTHIGALLAEASIVASRLWSAQGNRPMALAHCAHARKLGDDLQDLALTATAQIFESNLRSEAASLIGNAGDLVQGLRMLQQAQARSAALGPAARARLAAEQAQVFAVLQLRQECEDALGRAQTAAEDITEHDQTGLFSDWNHSRLQVYEGTCRLFLDQPKRAVTVLEGAVETFAADSSNANVSLAAQVDLASAYAEAGDLDKSCAMLGDTYGQLVTTGNRRGIDRAEQARVLAGGAASTPFGSWTNG